MVNGVNMPLKNNIDRSYITSRYCKKLFIYISVLAKCECIKHTLTL